MSPLFYQCVNFILLFAGLIYLINKGLTKYFKKQRNELEQKMAEASAKYSAMKKEFDGVSALLSRYETTAKELQESATREIEFQKQKIKSEAEAIIRKLLSDAESRMHSEVEHAKLALEKEVVQKALQAARDQLQKEFKTVDSDWISQLLQSEAALPSGKKNYAS